MRVFSFSKVIYDGYPSLDLLLFMIRQKYRRIFVFFDLIPDLIKYAFGLVSLEKVYNHFYTIILNNITVSELMLFKVNNIHKVDLEGFGIMPNSKDDLIISLEPSFIVDFFVNRNEYQVLCTDYDVRTRKVLREDWLTCNRTSVLKKIGVSYIKSLFIYSFKETDMMNIAEYTFVYRDHNLIELNRYDANLNDRLMFNILNNKFIIFVSVLAALGIVTMILALIFSAITLPMLAWIYTFIIWSVCSYFAVTRIFNGKNFTGKYIIKYIISILPLFLFQLTFLLLFYVLIGFWFWSTYIVGCILSFVLIIFFIRFYPIND
ncbi:MAG: hypothetical protein LBR40_03690 [Bacilli bacterium]|jgi:hypothetical protein|nr:hypothetical protein [Bacilli bacterium]